MRNSKNCQFRLFRKFKNNLILICKISRISNLVNSKNLQFGHFQKFSLGKIQKILNFGSSENFQFGKLSIFHGFLIF